MINISFITVACGWVLTRRSRSTYSSCSIRRARLVLRWVNYAVCGQAYHLDYVGLTIHPGQLNLAVLRG